MNKIVIIFIAIILSFNYGWCQSSGIRLNSFLKAQISQRADSFECKELIKTLDYFFTTKRNNNRTNDVWDKSDYSIYYTPFGDIYKVENSNRFKDSLFFVPYLLELNRTGSGTTYIAKIAFKGRDTLNELNLKCIYNIVAQKDSSGIFKLKKATDWITQSWTRQQVGNVNFIVHPLRKFSKVEATRLDSFNTAFAKLCKLPPKKITYYSLPNAKSVFETQGYDYVNSMYIDTIGGMSQGFNIIYSGGNTEYYNHEIVHLYMADLDYKNPLADEGFSVFIGGSVMRPLSYHMKIFKKYMSCHPQAKLDEMLFHDVNVGPQTSSYYVLSGVIAKAIFEKYGITGIKEWLNVDPYKNEGEEFYKYLYEKLGIKEDDLSMFLSNEINE